MNPDRQQGRLIAIDDNLDSAELVARIARKCGYEARAVTQINGLSELISEWKPTVLSLDLGMPEEDGVSALAKLQDSGFSGSLVIVSGQDRALRQIAQRLADARGINVAGDMQKPVNVGELSRLLTELQNRPG
jgi:DNA-binding response OmpR family regulator